MIKVFRYEKYEFFSSFIFKIDSMFLKIVLSNMKTNIKDIAITFFGICYISLFLMFIPLVNGFTNGKFLVWYIFTCAWGTDVFAYIFGKCFGKHKFSEISPNKSIEGCLGGILGAIVSSLLFTVMFNNIFGMDFYGSQLLCMVKVVCFAAAFVYLMKVTPGLLKKEA